MGLRLTTWPAYGFVGGRTRTHPSKNGIAAVLFIVFVSICFAISVTCLLITVANDDPGAIIVNLVIMVILGVMLALGVMANNSNPESVVLSL